MSCIPGGQACWVDEVLQTAVRGRSRLHVRGKPRLEGRLHEEATVHADLPHPPGGALERRSPDHGAGLHLHAPGDTPSRLPRSSVTSTPPSGVRVPSIARPCEWFFGRGPRAGATSSGTSSRRTRSAVRISRRSGATGSTIRGRVDPSEVARSSSSGSSAAASSSSGATPATGGRTQPTSSGSSSDSRCRLPIPAMS